MRNTFVLALILFCIQLNINAQNKSYLALGDSYTIGESVKPNERWPEQLVDSINKPEKIVHPPVIIAKTGWRTDELIKAIEKRSFETKFDLVSLLIGVNNQYQGKSIEVFKKEFRQLVEISISLSKGGKKNVFILSIPDYGATPFGMKKNPKQIQKEIEIYNSICKEVSEDIGVSFYSITEISRQAQTDLSLVAEDGLHPSSKMYTLWVKKIIPKLKSDQFNGK